MNLKPLGDRVVIKKLEETENVTKSGIVLPGSAKEEQNIAEVVAISGDIEKDEKRKDQIHVGDKVLYSKYSGNEVVLDEESFIIVKYTDLLAVIG